MPFLKPPVPVMRLHGDPDYNGLEKAMEEAEVRCCGLPYRLETKQTQTDYRESEAQTSPWTPPCRVQPGESPEVLTIAHMTWGYGLPAGMHEVEIINRMRMKRAWEAILPPMNCEANIKKRTAIIEALEINDWAFRESEIQFIMDMRMQLMEKHTKVKDDAYAKKVADRYERLEDFLDKRRDNNVRKIRQRLGRELRKLTAKHRVSEDKWTKKCDAARGLGESVSKQSAKNYHEIINKRILNDKNVPDLDKGDARLALPTYAELKAVKPKPKVSELCPRVTRWNEEKLRNLHAELRSIRIDHKAEKKISFMQKRYKFPPMPVTPIVSGTQNVNSKADQAAIFIQKLVTGRAIQCVMFEGRDRCRELIEELQSTHYLQLDTKILRQAQKKHVIKLQRDQNHRMLQEDRLNELLNILEGKTLAGMLDFLSKELVRLTDERKAHAFALLAERERAKRQAEEAGRRQLEEQRRRELDEMFRQIVKVNQDSVELYLEDIIKEGIEWASDAQAWEFILDTVDKMDKASCSIDENARDLVEEEMVSNMIYNFVLPDVEKQIVRKKMRERQSTYLRSAHDAIYHHMLELPPIERSYVELQSEYELTEQSEKEEKPVHYRRIEGTESETSVDRMGQQITGECVSWTETLTREILEDIICRSVHPVSVRSSASESSGSSHSSESDAISNILARSDNEDTENLN
ncbi:cilia- and flagella-associated protein 91-like [Athalia rosae]|uniref:cilia- and flagella-associated protein 91-like n=1 Tax=Athalia rosae TaxID=37344 RepID=UPI0020339EBE|nr:cilia- and flagella-associated protein 91-like [Athalia rosae]